MEELFSEELRGDDDQSFFITIDNLGLVPDSVLSWPELHAKTIALAGRSQELVSSNNFRAASVIQWLSIPIKREGVSRDRPMQGATIGSRIIISGGIEAEVIRLYQCNIGAGRLAGRNWHPLQTMMQAARESRRAFGQASQVLVELIPPPILYSRTVRVRAAPLPEDAFVEMVEIGNVMGCMQLAFASGDPDELIAPTTLVWVAPEFGVPTWVVEFIRRLRVGLSFPAAQKEERAG